MIMDCYLQNPKTVENTLGTNIAFTSCQQQWVTINQGKEDNNNSMALSTTLVFQLTTTYVVAVRPSSANSAQDTKCWYAETGPSSPYKLLMHQASNSTHRIGEAIVIITFDLSCHNNNRSFTKLLFRKWKLKHKFCPGLWERAAHWNAKHKKFQIFDHRAHLKNCIKSTQSSTKSALALTTMVNYSHYW